MLQMVAVAPAQDLRGEQPDQAPVELGAGDSIPMTARILAVAEVYDVLTSPDSYRMQMAAHEAEDELRNVAGSQLDGRLVWLFATQVLRGRHSDHLEHIADLEAELQVQRAVRGALDGPFVLGPPSGR